MRWTLVTTRLSAPPTPDSSCLARRAAVPTFSRPPKTAVSLLIFTPRLAHILFRTRTIATTRAPRHWQFNLPKLTRVRRNSRKKWFNHLLPFSATETSWGNTKKDQFWFNINGLDQVNFGAKDVTECLQGAQVGAAPYTATDVSRCVGWQKTLWNWNST